MRDWWLRTKLDLWHFTWCKWFGHQWERRNNGDQCRRCYEWRPTLKQQFGNVKISGPKPYDHTKHD